MGEGCTAWTSCQWIVVGVGCGGGSTSSSSSSSSSSSYGVVMMVVVTDGCW